MEREAYLYQISLKKDVQKAEFSMLMSEHFVDFPPSGGTRNYAHGSKGLFRTSY